METPSSAKGIVVALAVVAAVLLVPFAPSVIVAAVLLLLIAVTAYALYVIAVGLHRRWVGLVEGRRRGGKY